MRIGSGNHAGWSFRLQNSASVAVVGNSTAAGAHCTCQLLRAARQQQWHGGATMAYNVREASSVAGNARVLLAAHAGGPAARHLMRHDGPHHVRRQNALAWREQ